MVIGVFGKKGCKLCEAAKQKLKIMGLAYQEHDLAWHTTPHEGWRNDLTVELMTAYTIFNTLPLIQVNDTVYDYPSAMKELKRLREVGATQTLAAAGN